MRDDETWLAAEQEQAGACPACGTAHAQPIVYGMPDFTSYDRLSGRVAFYGCCLPEVVHRWTCRACRHEWGSRPSRREPGRSELT